MTTRSLTVTLLLAVAVLLALAGSLATVPGVLFRTYNLKSSAMEPDLPAGTRVFSVRTRTAERRAIVTYKDSTAGGGMYAHRVVAVGGDTVELRNKKLFVNGSEVVEPYVVHNDPDIYPNSDFLPQPFRSRDNFGPYQVPSDHFFVLGDNRDRSADSRYRGSISRKNLGGRVVLAFSFQRGFWRPAR